MAKTFAQVAAEVAALTSSQRYKVPPFKEILTDILALTGVVALTSDAAGSGPWTGTDNAPAIQTALDAHFNGLGSDATRLPFGYFLADDTLFLGRGASSQTGRMFGAGRGYNGDAGHTATTLFTNKVDRPGVAIQGARGTQVGGFSRIGRLKHYIEAQNFGSTSYAGAIDDTIAANWIDPTFTADEIALIQSRSAPLAGIDVDPYTGTLPSPAYVVGINGADPQYGGTHYSSGVEIEGIELQGFYVGVIVQPNSNHGRANGDFVTVKKALIWSCVYGVAHVEDQERCASLTDVYMARVHTCFTNRIFGQQTGRFGDGVNLHGSSFLQIYDFSDTSVLGAVNIPFYGEEGWREGNMVNTSSSAQQISVRANVNFQGQNARRGVPATMVTGGTIGQLKWDGGTRGQFYGAYLIDHAARAHIIDGTEMLPNATELDTGSAISTAVKAFHNATAGGLCYPQLGALDPMDRKYPKFTPWNLDTGSAAATAILGTRWLSNRPICTPLWTERHSASAVPSDLGVVIPRNLRVQSATSAGVGITTTTVSDRTAAGTFSGGWNAAARATLFGQKGDFLLHVNSKTIWVLDSVSGNDFTLKLLNGWTPYTGAPISAIDFTGATLYVACARWYSPASPVYGKFSVGSAVISEVGINPTGAQASASIDTNIGATDAIVVDESLAPYVTQANAILTARDSAAQTMTMTGNATASSAGLGLYGGDRVRIGTLARVLT